MIYRSSLKAVLALSVAALSIQANAQDTTNGESETRLDEVVVTGSFIPDPQRATSQVASFLQAEDLIRQGDSDAALALTRVSGLSIVGGRFAYVRGLGDRYSSALLNGSPLPSPQPLRRTVPLDLFPSSVLNGITVQKTYSPNYPGEFGGGVIALNTLKTPPEDFFKIKVGVGANTETTGKESLFVHGGDYDALGFDDGTRDIPDPLLDVIKGGERLQDQSDQELELIGQLLVDPNLTVIQSYDETFPDMNVSIDAAKTIGVGFGELGFVGTAGFDNGWTTERSTRQVQANGRVEDSLESVESTYQVTLNALASTTLNFDSGDSVQGTVFYVHDTSKEAQIDQGRTFSEPDGVFLEKNGYYERELLFTQLNGEHLIGDLTANWKGSYSMASRDAPYERQLERQLRGDALLFPGNNAHSISFSEVNDEITSGGLDLSYNVPSTSAWEVEIAGGVDYSQTDREFADLNLQYTTSTQLDPQLAAARVDLLFSAATIGPIFNIQEIPPRTSDNYLGDLDVFGAYLKTDIEFSPTVRADYGVRYETSELNVQTLDRFSNFGVTSNLDNDYLLPSASFTWNFLDDTQLRLGYSNTIARPQFRELASSRFLDPETDRTFVGNPNIVDSEFENFDIRLERYFGRNQFITISGFYKDIQNPIEESTFETSANVFETSFINAPAAELLGMEAEFRTNFDMPGDIPFLNSREWFFTVNYTYTDATVKAEADDVIIQADGTPISAELFGIDGQPLQGTPEHIVNSQFGWESDNDQFTILFGWVDDRVSRRGLRGLSNVPDVVESPGPQLDLVYRRKFDVRGQEFNLGLSARNLLNTDHEEFQISEEAGRSEFNTYKRGVNFSASLSTNF
ncbi:TonB-dependent receptor domain-containing protein [Litorimonas sp.]|uniref:TonB-dependent receptor domain-containing protein n=1 Tax=Litorimonas sp. TaxID=1892381 RepID=UPI003A89E659